MQNINKVLFVIIGTMIGAGFASGKEIYNFFIIYGIYGVIGIIIASSIIGYLLAKVLKIVCQKQISNYDTFLIEITKKYSIFQKHPYIVEGIKNTIKIFLLISFYIMIAAFSAYFSQEFNLPTIIGAIILATICYLTFMGSIERIAKVNLILIPILIVIIIILASSQIQNFSNINKMQVSTSMGRSIKDAVLYASYNSITLIPIIIPLRKYITKKQDWVKISIMTTVILSILAIAIFGIVLKINIDINKIELPTVYVATSIGKLFKYIYGTVIILAIFTSAISAGYGILENSLKNRKRYKILALAICASSVIVSKIGFSWLVNTMYPIFGVLGIMQILLVMNFRDVS